MPFLDPPKRILVIDDEEGIVEYIRIILRTRGYESIPAYDGEQGLALLQSERPDLIISDLRMPKMSGLEFARRRKELPQDLAAIPLLVISSMGNEQQHSESFWCEGLGCDDFLAKPFEPLTLLGRVEALLRRERYRSNETPQPKPRNSAVPTPTPTPTPTPSPKAKSSKPTVRQFTVDPSSDLEPAEVVRQSLAVGHGDESLLPSPAILAGVRRPSMHSRTLDISTLYRKPQEAEIAVLREEPSPDDGTDPIAYDERYILKQDGSGWKISRILQERLAAEI